MPKVDAKTRLERFKSDNMWKATVRAVRVFWYFFRYLKPYKPHVLLILLLSMLNGPIWIINGLIQKYAVDGVVMAEDLPLAERVDGFIMVIIAFLVWYIVYIFNKEVLSVMVGYYLHLRLTLDVFRDFYLHQIKLDLGFHRSRSIGEHMYRTSEDAGGGSVEEYMHASGTIIGLITDDWFGIIRVLSEFIIAVGLFQFVDPVLGTMVAVYLIVKIPAIHYLTTWRNRLELELREVNQERYAVERDIVAGMKNFRSLGVTRMVKNRYVSMMTRVQLMFYKRIIAMFIIDKLLLKLVFQELVWKMGMYTYVYYGVMVDTFTIGDFFLISQVAARMESPMAELVEFIQRLRRGLVPAYRMYETFSIQPTLTDKPKAPVLPPVKGVIEFKDVSFAYKGGPLILDRVSFKIEPGERVAFVGPSGSGKSTIFKLMLRLHDPVEGNVLVEGKDLRDIRLKSWLNQCGVLMQQTHIFSGSIAENIRYGNTYADLEEVEAAVDRAELREFVDSTGIGLDTFLGEGTKLSGGQKQRVGIARTLIRDSRVYLMDEPTSALDVVVETEILQTIEKVTRNKTSLFISHRIRPILWVDRLVVLSKSGVEAVGTHEKLLETSPTYQALWKEQNRWSEGLAA